MGCLELFILLLILLPVLLFLFFFQIITISFAKLGVPPEAAAVLLILSLAGSMINIPLSRRQTSLEETESRFSLPFIFYTPPKVRKQTLAINVGGAVIPVCFSIYLLMTRAPLGPTLIATAVVAGVAKMLARPRPGTGITLPLFVPPLVSVGLSLLLAPDNSAPVAYICGTMGTLIGADLLNFRSFEKLGGQVLSIGGAGVFDGIFLVGIAAALLA